MKKNIVFVDSTYPRSYDSSSIESQALGGTEASVIRTAKILSKKHHVTVLQKFRDNTIKESDSLIFAPLSIIDKIEADVIVVLRKYPVALDLSKQFQNAAIFLWIHTYKNREYVFKRFGLAHSGIAIICNSLTHKTHTDRMINGGFLGSIASLFWPKIPVNYCYNPIPRPESIDQIKNINKLVFFSSPNKGLKQVLKCFQFVNKKMPDLRLFIANPGYKKEKILDVDNTVVLGSLPHKEMMRHVQQSLCVFYTQSSFAETFGLIYAEANAYNVPVVAHDIGSAREILHEKNTLVDVNDFEQVTQLILSWQKQYPQVSYNLNFSEDSIFSQWQNLFLKH